MSQVSIELMGGLSVRRDGQRVDLGTRRTAALFAYLVRSREVHQRDDLTGFLWDEHHASTAPGNLRVLLTNLRQAVGDLVHITRSTVEFGPQNPDQVSIDVDVFLDRLQDATHQAELTLDAARLEAALHAYRGDFLEGLELSDSVQFEHWQRRERDALHRQRLAVQQRLVDAHLAADSSELAERHARGLVELDPLDELSHRALIRVHVEKGETVAAVRQFRALEAIQRDELGTTPSPATRALVAELPGLAPRPANGRVDGAPTVISQRSRSADGEQRLQAPWSRFVGRKAELATMLSCYAEVVQGRGTVLLVEGEPGAGKTTLVRQFARILLDRDPDVVVVAGSCTTPEPTAGQSAAIGELLAQLGGDTGGPWLDGPIPRRVADRLRAAKARPGGRSSHHGGEAARPGDLAGRVREELRTRPVVLVVDNLQWAPPPVVDLLAGLATDARRHRLLLLGTVRSTAPSPLSRQSDAATLLPRLRRVTGAMVLDLDHDSPEAASGFIDALLADRHGSLPAAFRQQLVRRSEGHPLIAVELLRDLTRTATVVRDASGALQLTSDVVWDWVPERVASMLDETLPLVPEDAWLTLEAAAVQGHAFDAHLVARVTGRPPNEVLHTLSRTLGLNLGLVRAAERSRNGVRVTHRFRHRVMREHLLAMVDPVLRTHLAGDLEAAVREHAPASLPPRPRRSMRSP